MVCYFISRSKTNGINKTERKIEKQKVAHLPWAPSPTNLTAAQDHLSFCLLPGHEQAATCPACRPRHHLLACLEALPCLLLAPERRRGTVIHFPPIAASSS